MSVTAGLGRLRRAAKDLRTQWGEVKTVWHDENCRRFGENHIEPLLARLRTVELAMGHIAAVLQRARHDCG
jgi:hypothetical protein